MALAYLSSRTTLTAHRERYLTVCENAGSAWFDTSYEDSTYSIGKRPTSALIVFIVVPFFGSFTRKI